MGHIFCFRRSLVCHRYAIPSTVVLVVVAVASTLNAQDAAFGASAEVGSSTPARSTLSQSRVTRRDMDERLPRSAPDALRFEPGVSVQQTAHGQASPYVRGLTGQQVVHLFDGVRLNNGIYRRGPNQYFFTVDTYSVQYIDVLRGSASTRFGSDALGGAIIAVPRSYLLDPDVDLDLRPRLYVRSASADAEAGGRAEVAGQLGSRTGIVAGIGYRHVGLLRSGGVVRSAVDGSVPPVPRFQEAAKTDDPSRWRTQLGTGFEELTFDARLEHRLKHGLRVVGGAYGYRQFDAPRTDQCPPPEAPASECLNIREQFRTLALLGLRGDAGPIRDVDLTLSYQRHRESRERVRPRSNVRFDWSDNVDTFGLSFKAATSRQRLADASWRVRYGADAYRDGVQSTGSQTLTDLGLTVASSRGQYLSDSSYLQLGAFSELEISPLSWLTLRGGGRLALVGVRAPADPESGTRRVREEFGAVVGRLGGEAALSDEVSMLLNVDQGFRAPNLDDLTSRQQTGPGFQFENADLRPERSTTFELGTNVELQWLDLEGWAFATLLDEGIFRALRTSAECPPSTPQCLASRTQLQLVNADDQAQIFGLEGGAKVYLPEQITLRATTSWAWGQGPDVSRAAAAAAPRVPLSRVPPLNGVLEGRWRHLATGFYAGAAFRWALRQDRLAPSDLADARIPLGGTPAWATVDLRAGWRWRDQVAISLVVENVFDVAYRVHGSSINAPGLGAIVVASLRLWPWI